MDFLIANTFTDSLSKLTGNEQKAVKTTAFDLQMNPAHPGLKFHKLERVKDPGFISIYVNKDIRLIVHQSADSLLLCYVDHHDPAYRWAQRRKLEVHPKTGAAQLVEVRETVQEVFIPKYVEETVVLEKPRLFAAAHDEVLLSYGVPAEWLADVKQANEDSLLDLVDHLPEEAAQALLELATGGTPAVKVVESIGADPFEHPDAQRRFRVMNNVEDLERALDFPWEKWTIFLHPEQRATVEYDFNGPARVSGSAGTGKTVVALHRAVFLARQNPDARILLTTFSEPLANALKIKLHRLVSNQPRLAEQIDVDAMLSFGKRLYQKNLGKVQIVSDTEIQKILKEAAQQVNPCPFSEYFLFNEWQQVVDAWQLTTWEAYQTVPRLGRKTRLLEAQRKILWDVFEKTRETLNQIGKKTSAELFNVSSGLGS